MAQQDVSYEQAKARLDEIVAALEDKDLALDDMVALWDEGERMASVCDAKLAAARARLEAVKPGEASE